MSYRSNKDIEGQTPSSSSPAPSSSNRRRLKRRIHDVPLLGRTIRAVRWILGPSRPSPMPPPHPSLSLSLTLPTRSWRLPLDEPLRRWTTRRKLHYALWPFLVLWATMFVLLTRQQYYNTGPPIIDCTSGLWDNWPPDICGVNASACMNFLDSGTYRCMGGCLDVTLGNPRWVGDEEVNGVPYVVGSGTYRADSWACASAIHAGLISPRLGGCFTLNPASPVSSLSTTTAHGVSSTSFLPSFPGGFTLEGAGANGCIDLHPIITGVNAACLLIVTLFFAPSPHILFSILLVLGYFQLVLYSNPPSTPPNWETVLARLPPTLIAGYWMWKISFRRTLTAFTELPVETAIWQGAGYWIGVESSSIFSKLPITRLGYGTLSPEGVITLIVIIVLVIIIVLVQAYQMRKYGLLQYYLVRYIVLVPILIILAFIPNYTLRLHHYLLALIAIPVLSLPNRVSLFGQAFALGLFLDGSVRWGWDSILEYTASLLGDAVAGTGTPLFYANLSTSQTIAWWPLSTLIDGYDGVSVLVDDVLQGWNEDGGVYSFANLTLTSGIDHFFRLAYSINGTTQDFSDPIILGANGTWTEL